MTDSAISRRLSADLLSELKRVGDALDADRAIMVVGAGHVLTSDDRHLMEKTDESEGTGGPAAGSRQGAARSWRSSGETARLGLVHQQAERLAGLEALYEAYPTSIMEGDYGLWIIVTSKPLGYGGPQVTFVLAYPCSERGLPRAWAFWKLGDFPKFIGPRHTNFPDASICAYGAEDDAWERKDGLVALIDLYSTWALRHLYLQHFGRWPGRQYGASALYRRTEFSSEEWCGCGSRKRYGECHEASDNLVPEQVAREEHRRALGSEYGPRRPPLSVMKFVRSNFKKLPSFRDAFEGR